MCGHTEFLNLCIALFGCNGLRFSTVSERGLASSGSLSSCSFGASGFAVCSTVCRKSAGLSLKIWFGSVINSRDMVSFQMVAHTPDSL